MLKQNCGSSYPKISFQIMGRHGAPSWFGIGHNFETHFKKVGKLQSAT